MPVRAKFKCVKNKLHGEVADIGFEPVYSGSEENAEFFKWTPSGSIEIGCANPSATVQFEVGKEYYVDFIPANN